MPISHFSEICYISHAVMATLVHASTDWQVFVNKNGGMCKKFDELHEEL